MTSFRRLVMAFAEAMAVMSIFFCTFVGGLFGAASGAFRSGIFVIASNVDISMEGLGRVASGAAVVGFIVGAIMGFVLSATLAGILLRSLKSNAILEAY
jgi:membrane associated rhomboid family serine protease